MLKLLRLRKIPHGIYYRQVRLQNWEALEAAKALAKFPDETVPLLEKELNSGETNAWVLYALGLCRTPQAVALLKEKAEKEGNIWSIISIVYALSLAGEEGRKALDELSRTGTGRFKTAVQWYRRWRGRGMIGEEIRFPEIPGDIKLPKARLGLIGRFLGCLLWLAPSRN